jgi:predicted molibdopterin-dependent oxidoreductase YjgC
MFKPLPDRRDRTVTVTIEGRPVTVPEGQTVAAAVLAVDLGPCRTTPVSGSPRAPYCMMGLCFDCLMEIDGVANIQTCLVEVRDGMEIRRQQGAPKVGP